MGTNNSGTGKTATVIGATGLIGKQLVQLLSEQSPFDTVRVLVRRPVPYPDPVIQVREIDFSDDAAFRSAIAGSDAVFCAVGTTTRKVKGDRAAYRKVDHDIPVHAAQYCQEAGCHGFLLVSSIGASSNSSTYYLRLKGEVEDALKGMTIPSVSVFRPSLLMGKREEYRFGERMAQMVMGPAAFAVPSKYKPIRASDVARAMLAASKQERPGFHLYHYREMRELIQQENNQ
jgi:uncharacterized protein YbjT (DUF2867 family)